MGNRITRPSQVQYQEIAEPVFVPDPLPTWLPSYPDFARSAVLPIAVISTFFAAPIEPPPVPPFDPADGFPYVSQPTMTRDGRPVAAQQAFAGPDLEAGIIPPAGLVASWEPTYPDFARAAPRPVERDRLAQPVEAQPDPLNPADGFPYVSQPTTAPGFAPLVAEGISVRPEIDPPDIPPPVLSWAPTFPNFARALPQPVERDRHAAPVEPPAAVFDPADGFPWVNQPDFARGREPLVSVGVSVRPGIDPPTIPPPVLSWLPSFPNFARAFPQPVERDRLAQPLEPQPDLFDPSAGFPWAQQPETARGQTPLIAMGFIARPALEPAAIPPPILSWAPSCPSFARMAPQPVERDRKAAPVEPPAPPFDPASGFPWSQAPAFARARPQQVQMGLFAAPARIIPVGVEIHERETPIAFVHESEAPIAIIFESEVEI